MVNANVDNVVRRYQREVIRIHKSKNRQHNGQKKSTKGQTMIYKIIATLDKLIYLSKLFLSVFVNTGVVL
jgi:hypothetical protein